jgi:hypothetical protein
MTEIALPPEAIVNAEGMVAMKHRRLVPIMVQCGGWPNKREYIFSIRANIPMTWVRPEDVACMMNVKWGCCGKKKPGGVIFANADDVRRWTNGGGR